MGRRDDATGQRVRRAEKAGRRKGREKRPGPSVGQNALGREKGGSKFNHVKRA